MIKRNLVVLGALVLSGCAFDATGPADSVDESATGEQEVASTSQALESWVSGPYNWKQGDQPLFLKPVSSYICALSRVQGRFGGGGEAVRLQEDGNFWFLGGSSQQQGVAAQAYCYARSRMVPDTGATSGEFANVTDCSTRCFFGSVNTWGGDAATMVSGIAGRFDGLGENVFVRQGTFSFVPSTLNTTSASKTGTNVWGFAHSVRFRPTASNWAVMFVDPNGAEGNVFAIPELSATGASGATVLAPLGRALCYFTGIAGGFFGGGEWAQIGKERIGPLDYWVLRTGQGTSSANVTAHARCISRTQQ